MFMFLFIYGKLTFLFVQKQTFFATQHKILALLATFFYPDIRTNIHTCRAARLWALPYRNFIDASYFLPKTYLTANAWEAQKRLLTRVGRFFYFGNSKNVFSLQSETFCSAQAFIVCILENFASNYHRLL
jgi:hypothetical protein